MSATLSVTLRDVTLHDAGHYFLTIQYLTRDGDEKKVRTEVSGKTSKPEFKNRSFSLPIRVTDGVIDEAELQFGAFLVVRSEGEVVEGEQRAAAKGSAKLAGLCAKQLADLAPALAAGPLTDSLVFSHPDGATIGSTVVELRVEMGEGAAPLHASAEQLDGGAFEVVVRNGVNLSGVGAAGGGGGAGGGGLEVSVSAVCAGASSGELVRTRPAAAGPFAAWNETHVLRPRARLTAERDGITFSLLAAGGGGGALARVHVPLARLRDESARELRLELAEATGAALHVGVRRLPPAEQPRAQLELTVRQLSARGASLSLPPAGAVSVAHYFRTLSDYAPGSLPWRHAYVPAAPAAAAEALGRMMGEPPALPEARAHTWPADGGRWPQAHRWALGSATDAPALGSGFALEIYAPEWMPAGDGAPGGDGCEWALWAHATLPTPAELRAAGSGAQREVDVPFEAPLVLARDVASLPGASPPPLLVGSLRWLPPAPRAHAPRAPAAAAAPAYSPAAIGAPGPSAQPLALVPARAMQAASAPQTQLLAELEQKQALINRLLHEVDARTAALSRCGTELLTLRERDSAREAELARARAELAEKAQAMERLALDASQADHLDGAELARRHRMLGGAYRAEKARSEGLSAQLALLTDRAGRARRLEDAHAALQDAHRAQGAELQKAQADARALPKYKQAVRSQEKLVVKLEALVKPALRDRRALKEAQDEGGALRARVAQLEEERSGSAGIGAEEHVKLLMRAEQAERRATATEAEMAEAARMYAREIAGLKVRLAEHEAEALGGGHPGAGGSLGGLGLSASGLGPQGGSGGGGRGADEWGAERERYRSPGGGASPLGGPRGAGWGAGGCAQWERDASAASLAQLGKPSGLSRPPSGGGVPRRNSGARLEALVPRTSSQQSLGGSYGAADGGAPRFQPSAQNGLSSRGGPSADGAYYGHY